MHSVYPGSCDSIEFPNSNETIRYGLQYTPAYYEEEPSLSDLIQPVTIEKPYKCKDTDCVNSPVEINERCATTIDLPPLIWHGYGSSPKMLNITNTGRTILINGHWSSGRPYIEGGPLSGTYMFSQIHFHSPSEHELEGRRYPLEMHVVHYKTSYLTQERAMNEKDGTVVLVYLFEVLDTNPTAMSSVTRLAPQIEKVNSKTETSDVALEQIVQPFSSNYYVYWGSLSSERNSYLLQWIINGCILCVTSKEADDLLGVMNFEKVNSTNLPRMKPQDNTVYYVEENKFENKSNEVEILPHICITGHSVKDAICEAEITISPDCNLMKELQEQIHQIQQQIQNCLFNQAQNSVICTESTQCNVVCKESVVNKRIKSWSGLRDHMCCHPSSEKEKKVKKKKKCSKTVEVQTETCMSECENKNSKHECTDSPKKKNRKSSKEKCNVKSSSSSEICENQSKSCCTCESSPKKEKKKKDKSSKKKDKSSKKKSKKEESQPSSCCEISAEESKSCCTCDSSSSKKEKKSSNKKDKSSKKKSKQEESQPSSCCEISVEESKSSCPCESSSKKEKKCSKKKKKSRKNSECESEVENEESQNTIDCRVATVTDMTFDDILNSYYRKWLNENNTSESQNIAAGAKTALFADKLNCSDNSNDIKTLFEKKKGFNILDSTNDDTFLNFFLSQDLNQSRADSLVMSPKELEDIKFLLNQPGNSTSRFLDFDINNVQVSEAELPKEILGESSKEFCIQVELVFRSKNENFSNCAVQEFNLTLIYNQNILQEYKGVIHPSRLELGSYATLDLLAKYPEMGSIITRLKDCTVKMETLDQISMRAKFSLNLFTPPNLKEKKFEILQKANANLIDTETQYSSNEISKNEYCKGTVVFDNSIVLDAPGNGGSAESTEEPMLSLSKSSGTICSNKIVKQKSSCDTVFEDQKPKNDEYKVMFIDKSKIEMEDSSSIFNPSEQSTHLNKEENTDKISPKNSDKELKCIFPNRKKAVLFVCERVEIDKKSGRKIFFGNFRSKDEVIRFYRDKKLKSIEKGEEEKLFLFPDKSSMEEIFPFQKAIEKDSKINSHDSGNISTKMSQKLITLTNTLQKQLGMNCLVKDRFNVVVGKPVKLEKDSNSFKRLASFVGMDSSKCTNISVYELKGPKESTNPTTSASTAVSIERKDEDDPKNSSDVLLVNTPVTLDSLNNTSEAQSSSNKSLYQIDQKSALLIIPIKVESTSKVEVVLIEHKKNVKKASKTSKSEIFPCLTYDQSQGFL